jgi:hypothetical protein
LARISFQAGHRYFMPDLLAVLPTDLVFGRTVHLVLLFFVFAA